MSDNDNKKNKEEITETPDLNFWKSFESYYKDQTVIEASHREFNEGVKEDFDPKKLSGLSRRKFLSLVAASAALAGAGCGYRDEGEIIPYNNKPENVTLGESTYYASTANGCKNGCGVLIETREGRPIKVDGNPDHPVNQGKACAKCHASILGLYDPERLKNPLVKAGSGNFIKSTWANADEKVRAILDGSSGKEIAIISHRIISPTAQKVFNQFREKYPGTKLYAYELFNDNIRNSAWKKTHGAEIFPLIKWDKAKIIVALESDFLGIGEDKVENAALFSKGRELNDLENFNRLYVAEGSLTVTGANADYRMKVRPDAQYEFVEALSNAVSGSGPDDPGLKSFTDKHYIPLRKVKYLVSDLLKNKGRSIVYAGNSLPEEVHVAVNALNEKLNNSSMYRTDSSRVYISSLSSIQEWQDLISRMNNGNVAAVIHFDSNPVYHLPDDLNYKEAVKKVPNVITLVESENESSEVSNIILPINHAFESWGDSKTRTDFYSMSQPVISPLYNTRQKEAVLLYWTRSSTEPFTQNLFHEYLMNNWEKEIYPGLNSVLDFKRFWLAALHDGVVKTNNVIKSNIGSFNAGTAAQNSNPKIDESKYVINLRESYSTGDGRFANNGWMQELPHPISKICWDNYAAISLKTAEELNVTKKHDMNSVSYDILEINVNGRKLEIPALVQPGAADKTITIELGYGRSKVGIVGTGVGFNAGVLMSSNSGVSPWIYYGDVKKRSGSYQLATTQEHHTFDVGVNKDQPQKRGIIREGTVEEYKKNHLFLRSEENKQEEESIYYPHEYPGVKWAMAVDLNKCLGCGECVVACNAENNVPIVGKEQVGKGREMHWIRVDRYYSGTPEDPQVSTQIMLCQQCDHAPCENVCPVIATSHSPDGINQMIYNRCVGTRYCSNNCPYKVRRFNFFNFRDYFKQAYQETDIFNLVYNPEVTVRSRGVMEKCTFCYQRIMAARSDAIREGREVRGTDVKTACQEACNTNAIKFGDMNDKDSEFFKYRNHELGYYVLGELNVRPNVTYIAKLRNTHREEV